MKYERGALSTVANILPIAFKNAPDGTLNLDDIESKLMYKMYDQHIAPVRGIFLESSHNLCGGAVLRPEYISKVRKLADKKKIKLCLDGARSWNASVFLNISMKEML
jgi:threonine aldolase